MHAAAVLSNADLATFLEPDDEWITSRTGMKERRISHVNAIELVCSLDAGTGLQQASRQQTLTHRLRLMQLRRNGAQYGVWAAIQAGATNAASMDVNTACTSFLYSWSTANAMIRSGVVKRALVVGVELISRYMDWENRGVAVLFGDGCAAIVIEATEERTGLIGETLGCIADSRGILRIGGYGATANANVTLAICHGFFDGPQIFKKAVQGMTDASAKTLAKVGVSAEQIDLVVPHQANSRIMKRWPNMPVSR